MAKKNIPYSNIDKLLEIVAFVAFLALFVLPIVFYSQLPDEIPTHFGFKGYPDAYGSNVFIWSLPIIGFVLYVGLLLLNKFVICKKSQTKTMDDSELISRKKILSLMQMIKAALGLAFAHIVFYTIQISLGNAEGLGLWFLPSLLVFMTFMPIVFVLRMAKSTKS